MYIYYFNVLTNEMIFVFRIQLKTKALDVIIMTDATMLEGMCY